MKDKIILNKLKYYLTRIRRCYAEIEELSEEELLELDVSFALTQYLTNIDSLLLNIDSEEVDLILRRYFRKSLKACRNIPAHDYDSLNWSMVKNLCKIILSKEATAALDRCIEIVQAEELNDETPDYTRKSKISTDPLK